MIDIDNKVVAFDVLKKKFCCDIPVCKGICCVHGDSGAPLDVDELEVFDKNIDAIKPYMTEEGIAAIEKDGLYYKDTDGDWVTMLIDGAECAYTVVEDGIVKCAIENAFYDGKLDYKKPISCHLYPIRITKYKSFDAVNYDVWDICKDAVFFGEKHGVKVYKFLKEPLIRKYGKEWYEKLEIAAKEIGEQ